jgi:hypothetical protein
MRNELMMAARFLTLIPGKVMMPFAEVGNLTEGAGIAIQQGKKLSLHQEKFGEKV